MGVPQGSIFGPLLFLIYINDIVNSSTVLSFLDFADDTIVCDHKDSMDDAIQILNTQLSKVASLFDSHKLTRNVNKTKMIIFSRKKSLTLDNEVILQNEVVESINKAKFLGVIVDQHLKYLDTWSGLEAAKTASWPSQGLHHLGKFLEP